MHPIAYILNTIIDYLIDYFSNKQELLLLITILIILVFLLIEIIRNAKTKNILKKWMNEHNIGKKYK